VTTGIVNQIDFAPVGLYCSWMSQASIRVQNQSFGSSHLGAGLVAVTAWGLGGVIVKQMGMPGLSIGVYRFLLYGVALGAILTARRSGNILTVMKATAGGGIALAIDIAFFFSAVKLTSIANATVIGALQPLIVAAISYRLFGERVTRRDAMLGLVALTGAIVVVVAGSGEEQNSIAGDLLAVGALFAWSSYFVYSKRSAGKITTNEFTLGTSLWAGLVNIPIALAFGQSLAPPIPVDWLWLLALTFGAGFLGHSMMNWSIQKIPLWLASTMTLLVPVVATIAAWLFLDEPVNGIQTIAMGVTLLALAGVIVGQTSPKGTLPQPE